MKKKRLKVRFTVSFILVAMVIAVMVTACGSRKELERRDVVKKKETPLWRVLRHKQRGATKVVFKDKWFTYDVDLEYVKSGQVNTIISSCPVAQARFTVTDRASGDIVRSEMVNQSTCKTCHPR